MAVRGRIRDFVDRHGFVCLFGMLLLFYLVLPIAHELRRTLHPGVPPILEGLAFIALLAGTVASVSANRLWATFALGLALPVALLTVVGTFSDAPPVIL